MIEVSKELKDARHQCNSCGTTYPPDDTFELHEMYRLVVQFAGNARNVTYLCDKCIDDLYNLIEVASVS